MHGNPWRTVAASLAAIAVMVGLVVASVPLYRLFCRVTGYAGTPRVVSAAPTAAPGQGRITIRFDASIMRGMPWRFRPEVPSMTVRLGETQLATFIAENRSDQAVTGTASFNVTPAKAAPYVDKIACFCFTQQRLAAGERAEMPVTFYIDPRIADDPETRDVDTITLSYTFFKARDDTSGGTAREEKKS